MRPPLFTFAIVGILVFSCNKTTTITNGNLELRINKNLETKVSNIDPAAKSLMGNCAATEYLVCKKFDAKIFAWNKSETNTVKDQCGNGRKFIIHGRFEQKGYALEKVLEITVYDSFPDMAFFNVKYVNTGIRDIDILKWVNNEYPVMTAGDSPAFWSFQGSSTNERKDWILPVDSSFYQKNYLGMNNTDYGGGIPMIDLWRKDAGIAVGHVEKVPRLVSLPIDKDKYENLAQISVIYEYRMPRLLVPGDTLATYTTFVMVHRGDCYTSLQRFSRFMQTTGIAMAPVEPQAYEAVWCGWGYEQHFTVEEIMGTLPKVKELGLKWVDIDHGYQQGEGDWEPDPSKFPNGSADMRKLVDRIHAMGLKAKLWWAPLAVDPGSKLLSDNQDMLLLNEDGSPQFITFWDSYYMSPVYDKTTQHTREVLKMFLQEWDFDGLKMDGMHLNCVPPDFNPVHNLSYPEQACEQLPDFFKLIYGTARSIKPNAVLQICPCGDAMSFYNMPWTNQTVASDPVSSWQIRIKAKTYKALLGKTAYYGDHIELSDGGEDFASQLGVGAVLGTKFTWPKDNPKAMEGQFLLTPAKEKIWKKWIELYNQKMLSKEDYLGALYDIGYDKPEAHVIQKADTLFYSFYSPNWQGKIELRGLEDAEYKLYDFVNGKDLGTISSIKPVLDVSFQKYLLIEAIRIK